MPPVWLSPVVCWLHAHSSHQLSFHSSLCICCDLPEQGSSQTAMEWIQYKLTLMWAKTQLNWKLWWSRAGLESHLVCLCCKCSIWLTKVNPLIPLRPTCSSFLKVSPILAVKKMKLTVTKTSTSHVKTWKWWLAALKVHTQKCCIQSNWALTTTAEVLARVSKLFSLWSPKYWCCCKTLIQIRQKILNLEIIQEYVIVSTF